MHKVTVTGKIGAGQSVTSYVINNVTRVIFELSSGNLKVRTAVGAGSLSDDGNDIDVDISAATTVTDTITSSQHAFVIS